MDGANGDDPRLDDPRLQEVADRMARSAFHRWAGIELVRVEPGEVEIALTAQPHHLNLLGTLHGGMLATVADTAMGLALRTKLEPGTSQVTGQLNIHYLRTMRAGRVTGVGRVVKPGRQMGYAEAEVLDDRGRLLARASSTFIVLRERDRERAGLHTPPAPDADAADAADPGQ